MPVLNESAGIRHFHERTTSALRSIPESDFQVVYVDDGSSDGSGEILRSLAAADPRVTLVLLSRNFGHQVAITAGLDYAHGDAVVFIDADLQDPPELIPELVARWREGYDVVAARRIRRKGETRLKLLTASAFYRLLRKVTNIDIPPDVGDFRLISRRVADHLRSMRERDRFIRGLVSWLGFRQTGVPYTRDRRYAGRTKFSFMKMLAFAADGIASFSSAPLRLATWLGYGASALAFLYLISVFVQKLLGHTVQGWATIMVAVLFLGGVQLICVGILGEYLGRVFNEIKPRPLYVVDEIVAGAPPATASAAVARHDGR